MSYHLILIESYMDGDVRLVCTTWGPAGYGSGPERSKMYLLLYWEKRCNDLTMFNVNVYDVG